MDFSTTEGARAVELSLTLALDIRRELKWDTLERDTLERKVALYERSLGLAVIPVMLRRAVIKARRSLSKNTAEPQ